tara:strand:+ start:117 stop:494 length:378 start_codon:yes stop_codon:yes gene_type:complete
MQLTKNFNLSEFACKDGTPVPVEMRPRIKLLAENLQTLRDYIEKPIRINSAYRTEEYNARIGGATRSQHVKCTAADIVAVGLDAKQVQDAIEYLITAGKMDEGGMGRYSNFTHYDVRGYRSRWEG